MFDMMVPKDALETWFAFGVIVKDSREKQERLYDTKVRRVEDYVQRYWWDKTTPAKGVTLAC